MNWYYAAKGQQVGPFDENAFRELVSKGEILPTTLVWHSGMTGWKPLSEAQSQASAVAVATEPGPGSFCSECGIRFPPDEMIQFGATWVCANCKEQFAQKIREGVTPGQVRRYGGFWLRVVARLIDSVIIWIFFYLATVAIPGWRGGGLGVFSLIFLAQWAGAAAYEILLTARYGATLGKQALHLRVITARGGPLTLGLSAGRYLAQLVSSATLLIGYIMAAFDPEKRTLHDRICNTRVVIT